MEYKKVKNYPNFVRDTKTNAILNTSGDIYYAARAKRKKLSRERKEIELLKKEMLEIKALLKSIINNNNE